MLEGRTIIVFGIEHYNPLGIIRSLGEQGIHQFRDGQMWHLQVNMWQNAIV